MSQRSGGGGFGWFVIGVAAGVAGTIYGPSLFQKYVTQHPETVRVDVAPDYTPGVWRRVARFDVEFSRFKENGQNWDWPFTDPELQLCVREGGEYRKCYGPKDAELASCQGKFRCTTAAMHVPDGPFTVELNEWDDYNQPDPIGTVDCDIGQQCKFKLGAVNVYPVGTNATAALAPPAR
jgi:hypothetical protein